MSHSRVRHSDIVVGKPLPWDVYDEKGNLLLSKGYIVSSEGQVDRMVAVGVFANSKELRESRLAQFELETLTLATPSMMQMWLDQRQKIANLYEELANTAPHARHLQKFIDLARAVDDLCQSNPNLAQAIIGLKQEGAYSARHMLDTAVIVRIAAREMKVPSSREHSLICAALTMNLGSTVFQDTIKSQTTDLDDAQRATLQRHPEDAAKHLRAMGVTDNVWLRAVEEHHERVDGEGYPNRRSGKNVSNEAQLLRLADIYCARITFREYRSAVPLTVALRDILKEGGKSVESVLAGSFIRAVGIFPPGLQIRLANGEKGVVVRAGTSPNHPVVISMLDANGNPMSPPIYRDTAQAEFAVKETINPTTFNAYIDIEEIWVSRTVE